ncbi:GNAT family N-acetyltransferase [Terriglobus roseus]|nr:GNAT family N-acetyltransferase [Terriglobus roseus]
MSREASTRVDETWRAVEADTLFEGTLLPLSHRAAWAQTQPKGSVLHVDVLGPAGRRITSLVVQRDGSRILPGHVFLRVQRFGYGWPMHTWSAAIQRLTEIAKADSKVLRLNIEIFLREDREKMHELLRANGFTSVPPRSYRHTLTLPVDQPDEALLATRKSLRKRLRDAEKAGAVIRVLTEPQFAVALTALQQKAMERSGGTFRIPDWPSILKFSEAEPGMSRVVGLFPSADAVAPDTMLGFAWGCMHGDHAEYRAAGSAELGPEHRGISISHPLLWDLVRWTRENGGTWFDMGGVTLKEGGDDPLAGISATKRVFSETVEEVGEEWMLEPHPWKSRLAKGLGRLIGKMATFTKPSVEKSR